MFLLGKNIEELHAVVGSFGFPLYTAKQISEWMYKKFVSSVDEMSNISKVNRKLLAEKYTVGLMPFLKEEVAADGTKKYLFPTLKGAAIESAYIPDKDRATLCVSTQVGCKMNCGFCSTAKQGFVHSLSVHEIINQLMALPEHNHITNIVYMGMGEPFDNTEEVLKSIAILTAPWGLAMSPRRITVSTVGIIPGMLKFIEECEAHLAISLHSPFDAERMALMPVEKAYPIKKVIEVLKDYDWSRQRRLSFEYIMFKGINDSDEHLEALAKLLKGTAGRINLIKFHANNNTEYAPAEEKVMIRFRDELTAKGIITTIRQSRGEDIAAACGLLAQTSQN